MFEAVAVLLQRSIAEGYNMSKRGQEDVISFTTQLKAYCSKIREARLGRVAKRLGLAAV